MVSKDTDIVVMERTSMRFINSERNDDLRSLAHQIAEGIQKIEIEKEMSFKTREKFSMTSRGLSYNDSSNSISYYII